MTYGLPRRPARSNAVRFHPAFHRRIGFTELIVRSAVHGNDGRTSGQGTRFDVPLTGGGCGQRHADFHRKESGAGGQVARIRFPGNRQACLHGIRKGLAERFRDAGGNLMACDAHTGKNDGLRGQVLSDNRKHGHLVSPWCRVRLKVVQPDAGACGCDDGRMVQPNGGCGIGQRPASIP